MKVTKLNFVFLTLSFLASVALMLSCEKLDMKKMLAIRTYAPTDITDNSVKANGKIVDYGDKTINIHGFVYSKNPNPSQSNNIVSLGSPASTGEFSSVITNLDAASKYYLRAFISDGTDYWYGEEILFTTTGTVNLPTISTNPATEITATTAKTGGNITADGGATVAERGVCFGTDQNPDINGTHTSDGTGTGEFVSNISGLVSGRTYYVRAFATNSKGTAYGNQVSFVAGQNINIPSVTTAIVSAITNSSANCGGNVISDGGAQVSDRGVCWSISPDPTILDDHTSNGSGTGDFVSSITGLTTGTSYYVRAFATNSVGTAYGESRSFTTSGTPPTGEWLHYDSGSNFDGVGLNAGGSFDVAIRFDPVQLQDYNGWNIIRVRFYPKGASTTYAIEGFTGSDPDPNSPVFFQSVTSPSIDNWNEVILETPYSINANNELWVGYYCMEQPIGEYPVGVDAGPATPFYSDLIYAGGMWNSLASAGLNYNLNLQVFVANSKGETKMLSVQPIYQNKPSMINDVPLKELIKISGVNQNR